MPVNCIKRPIGRSLVFKNRSVLSIRFESKWDTVFPLVNVKLEDIISDTCLGKMY